MSTRVAFYALELCNASLLTSTDCFALICFLFAALLRAPSSVNGCICAGFPSVPPILLLLRCLLLPPLNMAGEHKATLFSVDFDATEIAPSNGSHATEWSTQLLLHPKVPTRSALFKLLRCTRQTHAKIANLEKLIRAQLDPRFLTRWRLTAPPRYLLEFSCAHTTESDLEIDTDQQVAAVLFHTMALDVTNWRLLGIDESRRKCLFPPIYRSSAPFSGTFNTAPALRFRTTSAAAVLAIVTVVASSAVLQACWFSAAQEKAKAQISGRIGTRNFPEQGPRSATQGHPGGRSYWAQRYAERRVREFRKRCVALWSRITLAWWLWQTSKQSSRTATRFCQSSIFAARAANRS
jgi:hypothetical protein